MRYGILTLMLTALCALAAGAAQDAPPVWYYVALGDSIGAGYNNGERSYVGAYARAVAEDTGAEVRIFNKSRPGWRTRELLAALRQDGTFRTSVQNARMVSWNIGSNDLLLARQDYLDGRCGGADGQDCMRRAQAEVEANWVAIAEEVLALRPAERHLLRALDFYNPLVDEDRARDSWAEDGECADLDGDGACNDFEVFKRYFDELNAFLREAAASRGVGLAAVSQTFNGPDGDEDPGARGWLARDGLHPNDEGHAVIGEALRLLGYQPLWPESAVDDSDRDGDGVPDDKDFCPDFPGTPATNGC